MIGMVAGVALILVGTIFLLNNLGLAHLSVKEIFGKWWPAILIIVGISFLTRRLRK